MSENNVKNAIIEYLIYRGALVLRINSGAAVGHSDTGKRRFLFFVRWFAQGVLPAEQVKGVSDIFFLLDSKAYFIECKIPGKRGKATPAQRRFLAEAKARGAITIIASSIEDVEAALQ
jgi:hypothetical protein